VRNIQYIGRASSDVGRRCTQAWGKQFFASIYGGGLVIYDVELLLA
jgi:hypothetical protein